MAYKNIKIELIKREMTLGELAKIIGICRVSMSRKINGHDQFNMKEVKKILETFYPCTFEEMFNEEVV